MTEVNSLSIIENTDMTSFKATMSKIGQFQRLVRENLQDGKDYGTIPGTHKPTLYKPGAEKILMLMGLQSTYEIIDSTRDFKEGFFQYQVRCTLKKNEAIITQGLGACNSKEKKYERQSGFNIDNTILKMAKKRSQVDASLTVASLSEIFTQDLEDTGVDDDDNNHHSQDSQAPANNDLATQPQLQLIEKQILGSHLLTDDEADRLRTKIENGITKTEASKTISWWVGDPKKFIMSERKKREEAERNFKPAKKGKLEIKDVNAEFPVEDDEPGSSPDNAIPFKGKRYKGESIVEDFISPSDMPE